MKRRFLTLAVVTGTVALCLAGSLVPAAEWTLDSALRNIDTGTKSFRSATADVQITRMRTTDAKSPDEAGKAYLRSDGRVRLDLTRPAERTVLCLPDVVYLYDPGNSLVERYKIGKRPERLEQYLLLGFSTRGTKLNKDYLVTLLTEESLDGQKVLLFELTPKRHELRSIVSKIHLWISESTWLPIQQKAFQGGGDKYVLVRYTGFASNVDIDNAKFKANWPKGTKVVNR